MRGARLSFRRRVESLDDTNVRGHYEGWFVYPMADTLPWPQWDWDPKVVFKDMRLVSRHGYIGIWHGHMERPQTRARDRKSTRLNSSHYCASRMPSSA